MWHCTFTYGFFFQKKDLSYCMCTYSLGQVLDLLGLHGRLNWSQPSDSGVKSTVVVMKLQHLKVRNSSPVSV